MAVNVDLHHVAEVAFVRFLPWKVTLPFLPLSCILWKQVAMHRPHFKKHYNSLLEGEYLHKLFGIILHKRFISSSHLLIYSIIYMYKYVRIDF